MIRARAASEGFGMPKIVRAPGLVGPIDRELAMPNNRGVNAEELIEYFGSVSATARALGVKDPSVSEWRASGVVPELRQYQAQIATGGRLRADVPALRLASPSEDQQAA